MTLGQNQTIHRASNDNDIASEVILYAPYPNPTKDECTVRLSIPKAAQVHLVLYDMLGRKAATIADEYYSRGEKNFSVNTSGLPSGMYTLRLQTSLGTVIAKHLTIIR
jgi:hypothetical protein